MKEKYFAGLVCLLGFGCVQESLYLPSDSTNYAQIRGIPTSLKCIQDDKDQKIEVITLEKLPFQSEKHLQIYCFEVHDCEWDDYLRRAIQKGTPILAEGATGIPPHEETFYVFNLSFWGK